MLMQLSILQKKKTVDDSFCSISWAIKATIKAAEPYLITTSRLTASNCGLSNSGDDGRPQAAVMMAAQRAAVAMAVQKAQAGDLSIASCALPGWNGARLGGAIRRGASTKAQAREFRSVSLNHYFNDGGRLAQ
jgi:hypothetical protein